jgi:hypothetical protein
VGGTNETLADVGPVGVATMELHDPGTEREGQGTPGQFFKAAFFQRTLSSSRLYNAFLLISKGCSLLFVFPPIRISPLELACEIPKMGSIKNGKNPTFIL